MAHPFEPQKHLPQRHLDGNAVVEKYMMADLADLIRLAPSAARVLVLLMAYADDSNSVITNCKSIAEMLGLKIDLTKYAIRKLIKNSYITATEVQLNHTHPIVGVVHDRKEYSKSCHTRWEVIGEKPICDLKFNGKYNRFTINGSIIKCNNSTKANNVLINIKDNLFYDNSILDNELLWDV